MFTEPEAKPPDRRPDQPPHRGRRILRYTWVTVLIAAIYAASVLLYRWQQNRDYEAKAKAHAAAAQREDDENSLETMGGTTFSILNFYVMPGEIRRGEDAELCYGVANAETVKIEPDLGRRIWPAVSRCMEITPQKTTTYTLTAANGHGETKTASLTVKVR